MKHLGFLSFLAVAAAAHAGTFSDPLTSINSTYWTLSQSTPNLYTVSTSSNGVMFAWAGSGNPGGLQDVMLDLNLDAIGGSVTGDFTAQVDFADAVIGPGVDQIQLNTAYGNGTIWDAVRDPTGDGSHVWTGNYLGGVSTSETSGALIVTRTGSTESAYLNAIDPSDLIYTTTWTTTPLTDINFVLQNNENSSDSTAVTFSNFSITGASVSTAPEPGGLGLGALGLAGLAAARLAVLRQRRRMQS